MNVDWAGVFPAVTTQFHDDKSLDQAATQAGVERLINAGVHGLIMLGTVGENCSMSWDEKRQILAATKETVGGRVPILSGVAEYTTDLAATFARECEEIGIDGLMVLPGMVYKSDREESLYHFRTVAQASGLPIMVYNNPITYGADVTPEMFAELSDTPTIVAIKESSDDVRRVTDLYNTVQDRFILFSGVDDLVLESMLLGCVGWVSGLTNVFPEESVRMFEFAAAGKMKEALAIYRWATPSFHLDTEVKLVQNIKLGQQIVGLGSETVRAPRLILSGDDRAAVTKIIETAAGSRPNL
ncbi:MAG: dihydrodipicolinate synthase family protein [Alphaproteobacteria bacterium]